MNLQIIELINSFQPNSKSLREKYDQFIAYVYITLSKKIASSKTQKAKDKYKHMRQGVLEYIVSHKRQVIKELSKRK
jgi:hypothetical protein